MLVLNKNTQKIPINSRARIGVGSIGVNIPYSIITPHVRCILSWSPTWRVKFARRRAEILKSISSICGQSARYEQIYETLAHGKCLIRATHIVWDRAWNGDAHEPICIG